jgi:hypothetical protein
MLTIRRNQFGFYLPETRYTFAFAVSVHKDDRYGWGLATFRGHAIAGQNPAFRSWFAAPFRRDGGKRVWTVALGVL